MSETFVYPQSFETVLDDGRVAVCEQAQAQPYTNCQFSAGLVTGIEPDTIYLQLQRENAEPTTIFLRPDEAAAIIYCLSGAIWSKQMDEMSKDTNA